MSAIKWIKLNVDMFDDEKIKIIQAMPEGDSLLVVWIKLITLAGKTNEGGYIYMSENIPYTEEMLATIMNKPIMIIQLALNTFIKLGMIEKDEKGIYLVNFEKHQSLDRMQEIREYNRLAQQKHRAKLKQSQKMSLTGQNCQDIDIDKDIDKEYKEEIYKEENVTIFDYFENKIKCLNPSDYEKLNTLLEQYGEDKLKEAIDIASDNKAKSINYIQSILTNGTYKKKKDKDIPEWMNKEITSEDISSDELDELEKEFEIFS